MSQDSIGDFLTIIRNGIMASKPYVVAPFSRLKLDIANILVQEGFVQGVETVELEAGKKTLKVRFKFVNGESVIHEIKRISRPGGRCYAGSKRLDPVIGGLGISILTTSKGVMTDKQAEQLAVGGEVICTVW